MPLDAADLAKIAELIAASTAADKLGPIMAEAAKAHVTAAIGGLKLDDKFKTVADALAAIKPAGDTEPDPKKGKDDKGATDARLAAMEKQLVAATKANEEATASAKRTALRSAAKDALLKSGVDAGRIHLVMPVIESMGVLDATADGAPGWKGKDQFGVDAVLPMEAGAAAWVKTDDGKAFLPASQIQGDGNGPGNRGGHQHVGPVKLADLASIASGRLAQAIQNAAG